MKIVVINGTLVKGCTYHIKEIFLDVLRRDNQITEYYLPKDMPHFCLGCKNCFFKGEQLCPHAGNVMPIWESLLESDLIVFTAPVYALRAPAQVKALLDHLCSHWFSHRPDKRMYSKRAVILTNSIGAPNGSAQKDIATSLRWMGVSSIRRLGFGLFEGVIWDELSAERRRKIQRKTSRLAQKYLTFKPAGKGLKVRALFAFCKMVHKAVLKGEKTPSVDNQYWIDNGWISLS